jgi:hypothetical protein
MLSLLGRRVRLCDGISRRESLQIGALGFTGLQWPCWLQARALADSPATTGQKPRGSAFGKARACILIFNYGGPSHLDILDLKPDAPVEIRGEFQPIATRVPGVTISEHLPQLAALANKYTILRSVTHRDNDHAIGAYLALTGHSHPKHDILGIEPAASPLDMPSLGSVVGKLRPAEKPVFSYVALGDLRHFGNNDSMGQYGGCLGKLYDPFTVPFVRPLNGSLDFTGVSAVLGAVDSQQLLGRRQLLTQLDQIAPALEATASLRNLDGFTRRAYDLLASPASRDAFDLSKEPEKTRVSYGSTALAQNCLLARRLVEAGVPLVTVNSYGNRDWDTHGGNFQALKQTLLPTTDGGVSALLKDLDSRGMLEQTLVVWMGDMGRTPRINKAAGRDHWSFCYSILMAGGGVRGGQVYGSSDRSAAYPSTQPVSPTDVAATIYHCLGIDPGAHVADQQGRPFMLTAGMSIHALLG